MIEAACIAAHRAPGLGRHFAFERLAGFERGAWRRLREEAGARIDDRAAACIVGTDISTRVIDQARANARLAGLQDWLADGRLSLQAARSATA